jgi:1-acyl-sn-glycerol-3-phosphate acyltransferase
VRALLTVVLLLGMLVGWVLCWAAQLVVIAAMFPFTKKTQREDMCGLMFRTVCYVILDILNPMWGLTILRPLPDFPANTPHMYMMNHLGNADPWMCIRWMWPVDCKWICKGSLFKVPFGGWCLRNNGDLEVKFTKAKGGWGTEKGSVRGLMDDAAALLRRNQPIALFPEGVRNPKPEGGLGEFKAGFFDLAVKEGATIIPVALSGYEGYWPVHDWVFGCSQGYVTCGDPISPEGHTAETLMALVHKTISEMRDTHPDRKQASLKSQ